jgi:hypothetical protein
MKDDIRKKFEQMLETDEAKRIEAHNAAEATAQAARNQETQWSERIAGVLYPAIQGVTVMLTEKGWTCDATTSSKHGLRINVFQGDMMAVAGSGRPHLILSLERNGSIRINQATTTVGKDDGQQYRIEEITDDFIQERILRLLAALTSERPWG